MESTSISSRRRLGDATARERQPSKSIAKWMRFMMSYTSNRLSQLCIGTTHLLQLQENACERLCAPARIRCEIGSSCCTANHSHILSISFCPRPNSIPPIRSLVCCNTKMPPISVSFKSNSFCNHGPQHKRFRNAGTDLHHQRHPGSLLHRGCVLRCSS